MSHPEPVRLHPKVAKDLAGEACLDIDHEALWDDDVDHVIETYERIGADIAYVRLLQSGELAETWAVLRCEEQINKALDRIEQKIGKAVLLREPWTRPEADKAIKRLRKTAKKLERASRECARFWEQVREHGRDKEAAERLGLGAVSV
jgi:hypothetical protein